MEKPYTADNLRQLVADMQQYEKDNQDYIVFDVCANQYSIMSKRRLTRIVEQFWTTTTLWKIYNYNEKNKKKYI